MCLLCRYFLGVLIHTTARLASVAGAVIQAIGRPEFEDGLRTGVLQEDCWCPCGVRTNPLVNVRDPMWQGMTLGEVWMGIYVHSANQTPTVMSALLPPLSQR